MRNLTLLENITTHGRPQREQEMSRTIRYIFIFTLALNFTGCSSQNTSTKFDNEYVLDKAQFDTILTSHFPKTIQTKRASTVKNKSPETNKVSFILYEFGVDTTILDSLDQLVKLKHLLSYNWNDSCLFIIHRNETIDPFDDEQVETINNQDCLKNKQPIPNFINLKTPNSTYGISMDSTFIIYVLEAKAGNQSQYKMAPLASMPKKWENGFSRGIAISNEKAVIVYWLIIW